MAKNILSGVLDLMLDQCEDTHIYVCRGQPASAGDLADSTGSGAGGGLTLASGPLGGAITGGDAGAGARNNTYPATPGLNIIDTSTANHVAIGNSTRTELKFVTTCTPQALTSGGTVDTSSFVHTLSQPT